MCLHKRVVYSCNHWAFLELSKPCPVEQSFIQGKGKTGCSQMWSHGFDAVRVGESCTKCAAAIRKENYKLGLVKEHLKQITADTSLVGSSLDEKEQKGEETNVGSGSGDEKKKKKMMMMEVRDCRDPVHRPLRLAQLVRTREYVENSRRGRSSFFVDSVVRFRLSFMKLFLYDRGTVPSAPASRNPPGQGVELHTLLNLPTNQQRTGDFPLIHSAGGLLDDGNKNTKNATTKTEDIRTATSSLKNGVIGHFSETVNWIAPLAAVGATLSLWTIWQRYLRRIPTPAHIPPSYFHRRGLLGKATSVGDGDGFHLYHTPGGRLAGWGWLRTVPVTRKELKGNTIPIRIAGVDAPEGAHFGRTAQPYATQALEFLDNYILNRRVRAYVYRKDQYDRIVASVYVRKPPFFFPRKDVGLEMLKAGLAITYEAKFGAEYGGAKKEAKYKAAEALAKQKGKGMWSLEKPVSSGIFFKTKAPAPEPLESPMAYKRRMKALEEQQVAAGAATGGGSGTAKSGDRPKAGSATTTTTAHKTVSERKRP
ncbi:hypothetical protein QBC44DRAFT_232127 [Cladorrhinum sp. PSN332]|nr:hypothetical protein QBC44DRAFT_232127 [Cladorrhinum sp. PSN332]